MWSPLLTCNGFPRSRPRWTHCAKRPPQRPASSPAAEPAALQGVLAGFVTLGAIIALGFLLAQLGVLRADSQLLLSRLVFFVATPALLFQTLATAPVDKILTSGLAVAALSFVGTAGVYVLLARTVWRRSTGDTVLGSLSSAYVNAAKLGLPITAVSYTHLTLPTIL